ncbi:MAG: head-tail adaptor protein [Pseudomonadota bacterium]
MAGQEAALTRRMILEAPVATGDGAGGRLTGWQPLGEVYVALSRPSGRIVERGGREVSVTRVRIEMRSAPPGDTRRPVAGHRLRDGAGVYVITSVAEADRLGLRLHLTAEEGRA